MGAAALWTARFGRALVAVVVLRVVQVASALTAVAVFWIARFGRVLVAVGAPWTARFRRASVAVWKGPPAPGSAALLPDRYCGGPVPVEYPAATWYRRPHST